MTSTQNYSLSHLERTAAEPRQNRLYFVQLSHIEQANANIRLLRLSIPSRGNAARAQSYRVRQPAQSQEQDDEEPFTFLPGQWLDVYVPSVAGAGGFSITSAPADARALLPTEGSLVEAVSSREPRAAVAQVPYIELAVQEAPSNPVAAWLWRPPSEIIGSKLSIRVGGSFIWPPRGMNTEQIKTVTFIAGGMGINPIISILSDLIDNSLNGLKINILYTTRVQKWPPEPTTPEACLSQILFLPRLRQIMRAEARCPWLSVSLRLFITDLPGRSGFLTTSPADLTIYPRRIKLQDLQAVVIGDDADLNTRDSVCYLCGPPQMTDELVGPLRKLYEGETDRVFFEKWW